MRKAKTVTFLLLSLACFVVLEPIEHIFPFNFTILAKLNCDLFYLLCIWCSHSTSV